MLTLSSAALSATEITRLLLALAVLLGLARLLGEVARRYQQPMVIGEILAGILLGPTVFQYISPGGYQYLFPAAAGEAPSIFVAQESLFMLSAILLLLVAGMEVDLRLAIKHGKAALLVSALGVSAPFVLGFVVAYFAPNFMGSGSDDPAHRVPFGMFVGIAVSITALPVIARILMDLHIFKSDMGMLIMAAAMFNDILGWLVFAVILAMIGGVVGSDAAAGAITESGAVAPNGGVEVVANGGSDVMITLGMTVLFLFLMLTAGRWLLHRALVYVQAHWSWPGGVLGLVLVVALVCAAFTEAIGIHAIFGAFVAGIAIGDSRHLRQGTRNTVLQFITNIFAPLFFAGIGVRVNFIADFNPLLVLVVVVIACTGKIGGCFVGAKLSGLTKRESWAIGFGMATQGAMGIILAQIARDTGLINEELFVAVVLMAIGTSLLPGPVVQRLMRHMHTPDFADMITDRNYIAALESRARTKAIGELSSRAAELTGLDARHIESAVWHREQLMPTGLDGHLAVPHARLVDLDEPMVVIGRSITGVDFDAPDGKSAHLICLILTPVKDATAQVELLRMFAEAFGDPQSREQAIASSSYTEFRAALKIPGEVGE